LREFAQPAVIIHPENRYFLRNLKVLDDTSIKDPACPAVKKDEYPGWRGEFCQPFSERSNGIRHVRRGGKIGFENFTGEVLFTQFLDKALTALLAPVSPFIPSAKGEIPEPLVDEMASGHPSNLLLVGGDYRKIQIAIGFFRITAETDHGDVVDLGDFLDGGKVNTRNDSIGRPVLDALQGRFPHGIHQDDPTLVAPQIITHTPGYGPVKGHIGFNQQGYAFDPVACLAFLVICLLVGHRRKWGSYSWAQENFQAKFEQRNG
jgi:hypothetical protein